MDSQQKGEQEMETAEMFFFSFGKRCNCNRYPGRTEKQMKIPSEMFHNNENKIIRKRLLKISWTCHKKRNAGEPSNYWKVLGKKEKRKSKRIISQWTDQVV